MKELQGWGDAKCKMNVGARKGELEAEEIKPISLLKLFDRKPF